MKAIPVDIEALFSEERPPAPGSFCFSGDDPEGRGLFEFLHACPSCGELRSVPVAIGVKMGDRWEWDGNRESPTISPSIRQLSGCGWHGFLIAGNWSACGDGPPNAVEI